MNLNLMCYFNEYGKYIGFIYLYYFCQKFGNPNPMTMICKDDF